LFAALALAQGDAIIGDSMRGDAREVRYNFAVLEIFMNPIRLRACAMLVAVVSLGATAPVPATEECAPPSAWTVPGGGRIATQDVYARAAQSQVVLLGEAHDDADHHRWQLQTAAGLSALRAKLVLGFEMFPRRVQPALDRWVAGELDVDAFLKRADWSTVWGYDAQFYLPLFHLARINNFPMVALNVERNLVRTVSTKGLDAAAPELREGVTEPAPASENYQARLFQVYAQHPEKEGKTHSRSDPAFINFVQAQLIWDRAMAQALAAAAARNPDALIIGIMGREHVAYGEGVQHQLEALGIKQVTTLLPWDSGTDCSGFSAGMASAVFGLPPEPAGPPATPPQLLGVRIEDAGDGVRVIDVSAGGIAQAAGMLAGDLLTQAAGKTLTTTGDLRKVVTQMQPGTWLPLKGLRNGTPVDFTAKFHPAR